MGFSSMDDWINEVTNNAKYWRVDIQKMLGPVGAFTIGRWYDLSWFPGTPMLARHGEMLANGQLMGNSTGWTLGGNWSYANNTLVHTAGDNNATITPTTALVNGVNYLVEMNITVIATAGLQAVVGGTAGTNRTTAGSYYEIIAAGAGADLVLDPAGTTTCTVSNISLTRCLRGVQLFDTDMGSIYHGGNVTPDGKHILNAGVVSAAANFVPGTWMLVDYLKCYPGINMNTTSSTLDNNNVVINGTFTGDTDWTKPAGEWAWNAGNYMQKNGNGINPLTPSVALVAVPGKVYNITYTISNWTVGTVTASFGGTSGTARGANGTYTEVVTATNTGTLNFTPSNTARFDLDVVSVTDGLPRYSDGKGVRAMVVWTTGSHWAASNAATATAHNIGLSYTAPSATYGGVAGRGLPVTVSGTTGVPILGHIDHAGVAANNYGPFLPLAAGDSGILSAETFTLSAGAGTPLTASLLLVKPLLTLPNTTASIATERDLMNQLPSLPRVYDGAKLGWLFMAGAATAVSTSAYGWMDLCWG